MQPGWPTTLCAVPGGLIISVPADAADACEQTGVRTVTEALDELMTW